MNRICLILLCATAWAPGTCLAAVPPLAAAERQVLEDTSQYRALRTKAELPAAIRALCIDADGKLADPGQKWDSSCTVTNQPRRRLIWAGAIGDRYIVHYESGGRAHSFHVLVATLGKSDSKPKNIWRGGGRPLPDYAAFLAALRHGKFDDTPDHAR